MMTREEKLRSLEFYFLNGLAEDLQNGTDFDCAVLDAIDKLQREFGHVEEDDS
jgi:hypothetical protein